MGWCAGGGVSGPEWVSFGAAGPDTEVSTPIVRGGGDGRLRVLAYVGDHLRTLAALDLSPDAPLRIGMLLRIRAGLPEPRCGRVRIDVLRVGDVVIRGALAEEVDGEELVLGLGGLPGLGVHARPSRGEVVWMPAADARERLASVGAPAPWSLPPGPVRLPWTDLVVDPSSRLVAHRPARHPTWTDADALLAPLLRDDALLGGPVTGPDAFDALRWGRAAARWFALGDLPALHEADANVLAAAGDDCAALLAVAERAGRVDDAGLREAADRAASVWAGWRALTPAERERRRARGEGVDDACAAVGRFVGGAPWDEVDPWPTARLAWTERSAAAARFAIDRGVDTIALRTVLLDHALDHQGPAAARAAAQALRAPEAPHPLTRALLLADRLSDLAPESLAERVVAGEAPPPELLAAAWLSRPGDPSLACLRAAASPGAVVPDLPAADCLAAAVLRARRSGDQDAERAARLALARRWPDVWVERQPAPIPRSRNDRIRSSM